MSIYLRQRMLLIFGGILFYVLLYACYHFYIAPHYSYMGLVERHVPVWARTFTLLYVLVPLLVLPVRLQRPSALAVWLLYLFVIAPGPLFAFEVSHYRPVEQVGFWMTLMLAFAIFEWVRRRRRILVPRLSGTWPLLRMVLVGATVFLSLAMLGVSGATLDFSFETIYERRLMAREAIVGGSMIGYGRSVLVGALVPLMVVVGVVYQNRMYVVLAAVAALIVYGIDGTKLTLIIPLLLVGAVYLVRRYKEYGGLILLLAFSAVVGVAVVEGLLLNSHVLAGVFVRRSFVVPAQLTTYYWEFLQAHPELYAGVPGFSSGGARGVPVAMAIGDEFFKQESTNATVGIWTAWFVYLGYYGVFLASIVAGVILKLVDSWAGERYHVVGSAICMMFGIIWSQQALHTSMLSGGILPLLLLVYLFPSNTSSVR